MRSYVTADASGVSGRTMTGTSVWFADLNEHSSIEPDGPAIDDRIDRERQIDRATLPSWTVSERDSAYGKTEKRGLVTVLS